MPTPVTIVQRPQPAPAPDRSDLAAASESLESASAADVVRWAWDRYGSGMVVTSSFQDCVLLDVVASAAPRAQVVFLDTQYHFPETLAYVEQVQDRYGLNLRVVRPQVDADDRWRDDPDGCCRVRKVEPLRRALAGRSAWVTGLRRADGPTRASIPVVGHDAKTGTVKVNPLATWSDDDVADYVRRRELPVHPLTSEGYASIGCWPCTRPVGDGDDARAGRWPGMGKTECGLHR
ncbi:MAG TPA: phosphoadenylyl-sulfate reductase [Acidimicrobiales bacterium]|nr:phosphoadenylyl-sulfate reductase [Acidimicrobiales bacterium]